MGRPLALAMALYDRRHLERASSVMHELGVIDRLPRLLAAQAEHVKPIDYALKHDKLPPISDGKTIADSIDVHVPRNWRKAVNAIREANGVVVTANDDAILDAMQFVAGRHGAVCQYRRRQHLWPLSYPGRSDRRSIKAHGSGARS